MMILYCAPCMRRRYRTRAITVTGGEAVCARCFGDHMVREPVTEEPHEIFAGAEATPLNDPVPV